MILFSTNEGTFSSSNSPTIINKYDTKTKKLEKLYETPSPYPNSLDFVSYSKSHIFIQSIGDYENKYFDLDIKAGKYTKVEFSNKALSTKFMCFSRN